MRLRWNKLGIGFAASVPTAFWPACGGRSDQAPPPDAAADAPSEATVRGEASAGADAADDRASPDGRATDVVGDAATVLPMNDGAAETSPGVRAGDAAADTSLRDASDEAMADAGNVEGGAEASGLGCSTYCATVIAACTGESAQYKDMASCLNACRYFATGAPGQSIGDTLSCRMTHATYAMAAPNPHCWHAGPFGYGPCGALYDSFCNIAAGPQDTQNATGICALGGGFDAGPAPYNSKSDCVLRAVGYRRVNMETNVQPPGQIGLDGGFSANGPAGGNTFDCRAYHLVLALQGGSTQQAECSNVGPTSAACQ